MTTTHKGATKMTTNATTIEQGTIYAERVSHGIVVKGTYRIMSKGTGHGGMNETLATVRADDADEAMAARRAS